MPTSVKWGPKSCVIEASQIVPFSGLKITQAIKTDTQTSAGSASVTNIKGRDAMAVSLTVKYLAAAGVDPYTQMEDWLALVGQSNPLYIGGKSIGPAKLTLKSVEVSNTLHSNSGAFLGLDLALVFQEFAIEQTTKAVSSSSEKSKSLRAGASKTDKALRSPSKAKRGGVTNNRVVMLN